MHIRATSSYIALSICSWSEISSPEALWRISIREHVIILCRPGNVFGWYRIDILGRCWVLQLDISVGLVEIIDQFVEWFEVLVGIAPSKIIPENHEKMTRLSSLVVSLLMINPVTKFLNLLIDIVPLQIRIVNNGIILTLCVKIKTSRSTVMLIKSVGKDLSTFSFMIEEWSPYPFHFRCVKSSCFILVIQSCEEPSIETHIGKKSWRSIWMSERINVPSYARLHTKLFE